MRGRRPELRAIEGGKDTGGDARIVPVPAAIPEDMAAEWRIVIADLNERGLLTDSVIGIVETYIIARWTVRRATESLSKRGMLVSSRDVHSPKANPAAAMLSKAQETVARLSAELGLTPLSRSRKGLQAAPKDKGEKDDWASLDL
jgi:P27 family predicted phage terminase small subunit